MQSETVVTSAAKSSIIRRYTIIAFWFCAGTFIARTPAAGKIAFEAMHSERTV